MSSPLDPIWQAYQVTQDCLKIAQRSVAKEEIRLLDKTSFLTVSKDEAQNRIQHSHTDADDFVILSLWVKFERMLLDYVRSQGRKMLDQSPSEFTQKVHQRIEQEIEYWKTDAMLDLFKGILDANLIGQAKQIKRYRDWVAHRNIHKSMPPNVPPLKAYQILSEILDSLGKQPDFACAAEMRS